ncbi:MAG: CPBP family intramembrane metalloprotease [Candidatus Diapherotrites archaeon]|nr:CPBP family intramembrane metalloprotease [Candidatus Diapherotrites archaeon]
MIGVLIEAVVVLFYMVALAKGRNSEITRFEVEDWRKDVLIPFVLGALVAVVFALVGGVNVVYRGLLGLIHSLAIAPLFEELAFRGVLLGGTMKLLEKNFSKRVVDISGGVLVVLVALGFTMLHDLVSKELFVSAVLYGFLYLWRRNLAGPVVAHFGGNLVVWVLALFLNISFLEETNF